MTAPTIRSKRSEGSLQRRLYLGGVVAWLSYAACGVAATPVQPKLPVIQTVGVLPVQWEEAGDWAKAAVTTGFPAAVRASHRFRVLNDELVLGLWQDQDGRSELRSQYEMQGFVGLTVSGRGDVVTFTARLTDSALKSELLETDTVTVDWLQTAAPGEVQDRLQSLVFRLINRLPVDVSVTSVQGKFVTLSGGSDQHIEVGDRVDLVRTTIRSLHPANGTWLDFKKQPLGTAQVVEVKTYNSVARIQSQTYERAIEVGDGAKISALASRVQFTRLAANEGLQDSGNQDTIIVKPIYTGEAPAAAKIAKKAKKPAPPLPEDNDSSKPEASQVEAVTPSEAAAEPVSEPGQTTTEVPEAPAADAPAAAPAEQSLLDELASEAASQKMFDEINAYAGPYWWRLSGSKLPGTAGKVPFYLLNSIGGGVTHTLVYKFKTAFGGGIIFGKTTRGSYLGYQGYARIYWEDNLNLAGGLLGGWRAGGLGTLSGMAVEQEPFGGGDWIRGGGYGGLFGKFSAGDTQSRYTWYGELALLPLVFGRAGFAGNRQATQSSFGYQLSLGVYQDRPARVLAWGGGLDLGSETQTLGDGRQPRYQTYQLKVLAKMAL